MYIVYTYLVCMYLLLVPRTIATSASWQEKLRTSRTDRVDRSSSSLPCLAECTWVVPLDPGPHPAATPLRRGADWSQRTCFRRSTAARWYVDSCPIRVSARTIHEPGSSWCGRSQQATGHRFSSCYGPADLLEGPWHLHPANGLSRACLPRPAALWHRCAHLLCLFTRCLVFWCRLSSVVGRRSSVVCQQETVRRRTSGCASHLGLGLLLPPPSTRRRSIHAHGPLRA